MDSLPGTVRTSTSTPKSFTVRTVERDTADWCRRFVVPASQRNPARSIYVEERGVRRAVLRPGCTVGGRQVDEWLGETVRTRSDRTMRTSIGQLMRRRAGGTADSGMRSPRPAFIAAIAGLTLSLFAPFLTTPAAPP